ncbi:translational activator of cytochrome c oxidase 1 isoform X2 [Protopterus annectens]|uniref:translational activator of cytochrome c oxidase 1 isoform X2 n=1 Tax=Protopterus annectens TaxID=7888 RepID=UPI001CFBF667|nr:translational activator of cytochrome c oxidase 1 isoform X2 [Protopterus annectens]
MYFCNTQNASSEGGSNPDVNNPLASIIEQCRNRNMPKASIDAAIKGADKSKAATYAVYEGRGPGGSSLLIEVLTDSSARSLQELKLIASRNGGVLCDGARHFFDKKGVVIVNGLNSANQAVELDKALEIAIEAGAEDVQQTEDDDEKPVLKFICELSTLKTVREKLNSLGMQTLSVGPEFIPNVLVQLSDMDLEAASLLINKIDNCPDVVRVYDNIESKN